MNAFRRAFFILMLFTVGFIFYALPVRATAACTDVMPPIDDCPAGQSQVRVNCTWTCRSLSCLSDANCMEGEMCVNRQCVASTVCSPATVSPARGSTVSTYPPVVSWNGCGTGGAYQVSVSGGGIAWTSFGQTATSYTLSGLYFKNGTTYTWSVRKCTTTACTTTSPWVSSTFVYNNPDLVLGPGEETFISMYDNASIGTMDNGIGKLSVTYKTIGTGNGSLMRESYNVYQRKLWTTTTFTLPASSTFATVTLGANPNSYWNGPGAVTLKVKNTGSNFIDISKMSVKGKNDTSEMGVWPKRNCGSAAPCAENYICYNNVCRYGCGTSMDCPANHTCQSVACIPNAATPTLTPKPPTVTPTPFCKDTDGTDYFKKGTVTTNKATWTSPVSDYCATQTGVSSYSGSIASCDGANCYVAEHDCSGVNPVRNHLRCTNGCSSGECLRNCNGTTCTSNYLCYKNICREPCSSGGTCLGAYHCESGVCVPGASSSSSSTSQSPTATPYPSAPPDRAQLFFMVKMPDISSSIGVVPNVKVQVWDGGSIVAEATVMLDRRPVTPSDPKTITSDFFKNSTPLNFTNIPAAKKYTIKIKQLKTIRKAFTNVRLANGEITDCAKSSSDSNICGSLASPHLAPLYSGDSDGFNDGSGGTTYSPSFNKIDATDLQRMVSGYQAASLPAEPNADFNLDRKIDIHDLAILGKNYGKPSE